MDISLSYNWLKEYIKTNKSARDFAREFSLYSQTIDRVKELNPAWKKVITVKITQIKPHPNADKLRLAMIDNGQTQATVVCGAPNIKEGQIVPMVQEGGEVTDENGKIFTVKRAVIRGQESRGMLCSQRELGIGSDHAGIFILPPDTKIGAPLENILSLNDSILEIEVTSNRPDCMSIIGLAREASAIFNSKLLTKTITPPKITIPPINLKVTVKEKKLCPRYQAVMMTGITVKSSPLWLQQRLLASGIRPINNLVDITNYVLLEYGQPMHVFDYEKLVDGQIVIRRAEAGEKILALDGKTYQLNKENLIIADAKNPVAVAGVMGGELSAASNATNTIVFESANFEPVSVRKTARALNLHSESSNLFEKGLSVEGTQPALLRAMELTGELAGGKIASKIIDSSSAKPKLLKIKFDPKLVKIYLGIEVPIAKIKKILTSLGFDVKGKSLWQVSVPWWRSNDVNKDYDLVEEIARLYGYHNLPIVLPNGEIPNSSVSKQIVWQDKTKNWLVGLGFTEVYTYSLIPETLMVAADFSAQTCLKISNPLSADYEYLRPSIIPGILKVVAENQDNFSTQKIFELSKIFVKVDGPSLPEEKLRLTGAIFGCPNIFSEIRGVTEFLLKKWGIIGYQLALATDIKSRWQSGQTIDVVTANQAVGRLGLLDKKIADGFGIKKPVAIFDFNFEKISNLAKNVKTYKPLPIFPSVSRDLALVLDQGISWQEINDFISGFDPLIRAVDFLSVYSDEKLQGKKSLALHLEFRSDTRTLESSEIDGIINKLMAALNQKFQATLR